jgi:hypothetical protein
LLGVVLTVGVLGEADAARGPVLGDAFAIWAKLALPTLFAFIVGLRGIEEAKERILLNGRTGAKRHIS